MPTTASRPRPEADVRTGADAAPSTPAPPLRRPHGGRLLVSDVALGAAAFVALVVAMWLRHGGATALLGGGTAAWTALAQLTGLAASACGLLGLVLVARPRALDRRYGLDRLFVWHKWLGGSMVVLVLVHVATSVVAWSAGTTLWAAVTELTGREAYMAGATVGTLLLLAVGVTSMRSIRRRMSYETWYLLHLSAYVALALAFAHQVVLGGDLSTDAVARWSWIAVHLAVLAALVVGRWGRLLAAYLRPLRITAVTPVADGTVEVCLTGGRLASMRGDAGQFAVLRPLVPRLWWQGHPYSLSAAPTTDALTFTVKARGDASGALADLPVGSRVAVEGPYGALTPDRLDPHRGLLLVVGGVGVAPARALLQRLPEGRIGSEPVLLYRARHQRDLVHLDELEDLVQSRGGRLLTLLGRRGELALDDPFSAAVLGGMVPDLADRQAFVCGPEELCAATRKGLRDAGLPSSRVHYDRSWW